MRLLLALLFVLLPAFGREWKISYFFDNARETLHFVDIVFPSVQRGIAVGTVMDEAGERRPRHIAVLTADGGENWTEMKLNEAPRSLFFLNDSEGWMVTDRGISKTNESGRTWKRIYRNSKLLKVWFLDAQHGFAAGLEKTILETRDGGVTWKPVMEAKDLAGPKDETAFTNIAFTNDKVGMIVGTVFGTRPITIQLQTQDAGATWKMSAAPLNGAVEDLKFVGRYGLVLMSFTRTAEISSEVFRSELDTGKSPSVFRRKDRRALSVLPFQDLNFIATIERPERESPRLRLPTRVHIMESADTATWTEAPVDYRASATDMYLAGPDSQHVFAVTDTGMILRLQ